jgi:hypothetical protein
MYKVITPSSGGGTQCDATAFQTTCWSGACPVTEPQTPSPTDEPTPSPTPAEEYICASVTKKSDRQCRKNCNDLMSCPMSAACRVCTDTCACTSQAEAKEALNQQALKDKKKLRREHKRCADGFCHGKKWEDPIRHVKYNVPKPTPVVPCSASDACNRTSFCWGGACQNTNINKVCKTYENKTTDDGWTWEQIAFDPNFKCFSAEMPSDHTASRPKEQKHLETDHISWKGFVKWEQGQRQEKDWWYYRGNGGRRLEFV